MSAALVAVAACAGLAGYLLGRLRGSRRSYASGVRAGRIATANAHGHVDAEMHRMVHGWAVVNRQRYAEMPFVTREKHPHVPHVL